MMTERRISGGDVSEEKRAGSMMRKWTETCRPTLAAAMFREQSNDLQSWRGAQCGSNHSNSVVPPARRSHNRHGHSLRSQLDLQQETRPFCSKCTAQRILHCKWIVQQHSWNEQHDEQSATIFCNKGTVTLSSVFTCYQRLASVSLMLIYVKCQDITCH
jgi:hypothetical protein